MSNNNEPLWPEFHLISPDEAQQYRRIPALAVHWLKDCDIVLIGGGGGTKGTGIKSGIIVNTISSGDTLTPAGFLDTHDKLVMTITAHPNESVIACAICEFMYIIRFEKMTLKVIERIKTDYSQDNPFVSCITFNTPGTIIAGGGQDSSVKTFGYPSFVSFNKDSTLLAVASKETFFSIWHVDHSKMFTLSFRNMEIRGCVFSSHYEHLAYSWMNDRELGSHLAMWDLHSGKILKLKRLDDRPVTLGRLSDDGSSLAVTTLKRDCTVYTFDTRTLSVVGKRTILHDFPQTSLDFSPVGDRLISVSADTSAIVFRSRSSSCGCFKSIFLIFFIAGLVMAVLFSGNVSKNDILTDFSSNLDTVRSWYNKKPDRAESNTDWGHELYEDAVPEPAFDTEEPIKPRFEEQPVYLSSVPVAKHEGLKLDPITESSESVSLNGHEEYDEKMFHDSYQGEAATPSIPDSLKSDSIHLASPDIVSASENDHLQSESAKAFPEPSHVIEHDDLTIHASVHDSATGASSPDLTNAGSVLVAEHEGFNIDPITESSKSVSLNGHEKYDEKMFHNYEGEVATPPIPDPLKSDSIPLASPDNFSGSENDHLQNESAKASTPPIHVLEHGDLTIHTSVQDSAPGASSPDLTNSGSSAVAEHEDIKLDSITESSESVSLNGREKNDEKMFNDSYQGEASAPSIPDSPKSDLIPDIFSGSENDYLQTESAEASTEPIHVIEHGDLTVDTTVQDSGAGTSSPDLSNSGPVTVAEHEGIKNGSITESSESVSREGHEKNDDKMFNDSYQGEASAPSIPESLKSDSIHLASPDIVSVSENDHLQTKSAQASTEPSHVIEQEHGDLTIHTDVHDSAAGASSPDLTNSGSVPVSSDDRDTIVDNDSPEIEAIDESTKPIAINASDMQDDNTNL